MQQTSFYKQTAYFHKRSNTHVEACMFHNKIICNLQKRTSNNDILSAVSGMPKEFCDEYFSAIVTKFEMKFSAKQEIFLS